MAVDLTLLLSELQKKAYLADSSQDTQDLFFLLKSTVRADQNPILEAANDGALLSIPSLERTPSTIYYNKESKNLYFAKNNEWIALKKTPHSLQPETFLTLEDSWLDIEVKVCCSLSIL